MNTSVLRVCKGKIFSIDPNALRCGTVSIIEWQPITEPITLSIPGKGVLRVVDPRTFCLNLLMRLEISLTDMWQPDPENKWDWKQEQYIDALKAMGCLVEVQFSKPN